MKLKIDINNNPPTDKQIKSIKRFQRVFDAIITLFFFTAAISALLGVTLELSLSLDITEFKGIQYDSVLSWSYASFAISIFLMLLAWYYQEKREIRYLGDEEADYQKLDTLKRIRNENLRVDKYLEQITDRGVSTIEFDEIFITYVQEKALSADTCSVKG
ncbi:hypothetical protein JCM30760_26300 [Thiomicrorhabdus hydrogeniphila]